MNRFRLVAVVVAFALISLGARSARADDCDTPPSVGVSLSPQPNGVVIVTVTYNFPNTSNSTQRSIGLRQRNSAGAHGSVAGHAPVNASGTWVVEHDMSCRPSDTYTYEVTATACKRSDLVDTDTALYVHNVRPTVGVSYEGPDIQGHGTLHADYSFPNTQNELQRSLVHRVYSGGTFGTAGSHRPLQRDGTWSRPYNMTCKTGTFEHVVIATTCSGEFETDSAPVTVNTKPSVSASVGPMKENGEVDIAIHFGFPNTDAKSQRTILVRAEDADTGGFGTITSGTMEEQFGVWNVKYNAACVTGNKRLWVIATSCSGEKDEQRYPLPKPEKPTVSLTLEKQSLGYALATIDYDMKFGTSNWVVELHTLPYVDAAGQTHAGGRILSRVPSQRTGTITHQFLLPPNAQQVPVMAVASTCVGRDTSEGALLHSCELSASADPVYYSSGNVRVTDRDPLPPVAGQGLVRTYNSDEQGIGLFGRGFTTLFDRRMTLKTDQSEQVASIVTATNEMAIFRGANGVFRQTWPRGTRGSDVLTHDSAAGTYTHRAAGSSELAVYRVSDGRLILLRDLATGREAQIAYDAQGRPQTMTDSWSGTSWNLTIDATHRRVASIGVAGRPDLVWSYAYDASGNLRTVTAPGGLTWRTYDYSANRMTASYDGAGNLIESHTYDANGYGISSTGPTDEIANIQYGLPGTTADERVTRVTHRSGAVSEYAMRRIGGTRRTVRVTGGCSGCGSGEATYVHDWHGRVVREQGADGYVTVRSFVGSNLAWEERPLEPAGCDPATDPQRCRLDSDALAAATLEPTAATLRTTFVYGDAQWPERATSIVTPSIRASGGERREDLVHHPVTGEVVTRSVKGWTGDGPVEIAHVVTTSFYAAAEPAAFDPGGTFSSAWLTLPQPPFAKSIDGPRTDVQDVTQYVYYPVDASVPALLRGLLAARKDASGHVTRYESYDLFGNATRVVDPNGAAVESTFDALGRLLTTTAKGIAGCDTTADPLCAADLVMQRGYAGAGPLASETRPGGGVHVYAYDSRGRVSTVSRGPSASDLRERVETQYDPLTGRKSLERFLGASGATWVERRRESYVYDSEGRLAQVVHPDSSSVAYTYDASDRLLTVRDENHTSPNTRYEYDPAGRQAKVTQTLAGAPGGAIATRYGYDRHGNLVSVTDPNGNVTSYVFDDFGRMLSQQSPVTGTTTYAYDLAGNLTQTVDANGATTMRTYDAAGRVTIAVSTRAGQTETVTWSYDATQAGAYGAGRLAAMTDPAGVTTYAYDRRGLVRQETRTVAGVDHVQRYGHDADGNRSSLRYASGRTVTYQYDYAGRPVTATGTHGAQTTPYVTAAAYLPFGPLTSLTLGNGASETRTFDQRYLPAGSSLAAGGSPIAQYTYTVDPAGNISAIADTLNAAYSRTFGYDALRRLVTANSGTALWGAGSYTYDAMGNLLTATLGGVQRSFSYQGTTPKIDTATGLTGTMAYDAAGNELKAPAGTPSNGSPAAGYSPRNLLAWQFVREYDRCQEELGSACVDPDPVWVWLSHAYDGRGVRVASTETHMSGSIGAGDPEPQPMLYFYTPELTMLNVVSHSTGRSADVIWFGSRPVADHDDTAVRYTFVDHLGTPILQTSSAAAVVWRVEYQPYGDVHTLRAGTAADDQPLRFPGQQVAFTAAGGEERYNIFRWYRAGWGRYTQADPLGKNGDPNPYLYAAAAPLTHIDPLGEKARTCCTPVTGGPQPFYHCFIHVIDPGTNARRTYALHRVKTGVGCTYENDGFDLGAIDDPATKCGDWKEGCEGDRCVDIEHGFYPTPIDYFLGGGGLGTNSNTYAAHITNKCKLDPPSIAGSWQTPGWNSNAPAKPNLGKTCPPKR